MEKMGAVGALFPQRSSCGCLGPQRELLEVLETSRESSCGFWGLPVKQLWVMGMACPQGGIWAGVLTPQMEELGVLRTPSGATGRCWGSQGGVENSRNPFLPSLREQQWVLGTPLPVK